MNEVFGFKATQGGKHVLIAGHVKTKDGNVEFSGVIDSTDINTLSTSVYNLSNSLQSIRRMADCYHRFELSYADTDSGNIIKCHLCQMQKPCSHDNFGIVTGSWDQPGTVYVCHTCQFKFTYEGQGDTKTKVPYRGPVEPDVRAGEGTSAS